MRRHLFTAAVLLALCGVSNAKVDSFDGVSLGTHWFGPKRTEAELKGHIILWENWGYN